MTIKRHDIGIDEDGNVLPHKAEEVREIVNAMMEDGNLIAAIFMTPTGEVGVQVFGPPSEALIRILEAATRAYKKAFTESKKKIN